jgi:Holliday junction resolvasome RuvABC endonuclease subunit
VEKYFWTKPPYCFITLDTGYDGTGYAVFNSKRMTQNGAPCSTGVLELRGKRKMEITIQAYALTAQLKVLIDAYRPNHLIIEYPQLWAGNAVSMASASRGDLFSLSYLAGMFASLMPPENVVLIFPRDWKGQLSKDNVIKRLKKRWPRITYRNHQADAVGIGAALLGGL